MRAESRPLHFDENHNYVQMQLRKERLMESKFHFHRATDLIFRSVALAMEALWAEPEKPRSPQSAVAAVPAEPSEVEPLKKAA